MTYNIGKKRKALHNTMYGMHRVYFEFSSDVDVDRYTEYVKQKRQKYHIVTGKSVISCI